MLLDPVKQAMHCSAVLFLILAVADSVSVMEAFVFCATLGLGVFLVLMNIHVHKMHTDQEYRALALIRNRTYSGPT